VDDTEVREEARCTTRSSAAGNGGYDLDGLDDAEVEDLDCWDGTEEARPRVWVAEEAGPVVGVRAGEGELCQMHDVDAEGRGEGEAGAVVRVGFRWRQGCGCVGCGAEGVEGAALEADAEECLAHVTAVEDEVVAGGLAGREVGGLQVELCDRAEGRDGVAAGWVQVRGCILCWVARSSSSARMTVQRVGVLRVTCRHFWQTCEAGTTRAPPPR
jgi:hypothetical protein